MASSPEEDRELGTIESTANELTGEEAGELKIECENRESENAIVTADAIAAGKISLFLKATSDVPIMKKKRWQVDETKTVQWIITFIKRYLKLEDKDTIFLYVAQAFAPSPDQQLKNLYECFGSEGKLVLHYSKTPAWG